MFHRTKQYNKLLYYIIYLKKGKAIYGQEPLPRNNTVRGVNYQLLAVMLMKYANMQPPVAVDHSQQRTMALEMVDPIVWPLPPTHYRAVPPERPLHRQLRSTNPKCSLRIRSLGL